MTTHEFNNDSNQAERKRVERDTYLTRAQADTDLTSQGRFKKETATRVTGVPVYPSLPSSSPWVQFDQNIEPPFGVDVNAQEPVGTTKEQEQSSLALSLTSVATSSTVVGDRVKGPIIGSTVAGLPATDEPVIGSSIKRRRW
jgi:hypothetical protein